MKFSDRDLGMDRRISRRDFINGTAVAIAGIGSGASFCAAGDSGGAVYPPALTGMRGSGYPEAYRTGHSLRDGTFWPSAPAPTATGERYDLIVVGGGISGLAAAYLYQKRHGFRNPKAQVSGHGGEARPPAGHFA